MAELAVSSIHWTTERKFFTGIAIAAFATAFVGFGPTYYWAGVNPAPTPELALRIHLHGLFCTLWIVLLLLQTSLIATRRRDIHKRFGLAGLVLSVAILVSGIHLAINSERRIHTAATDGTMADPYVFLIFPFTAASIFALFAFAGIWYRRRPDIHKRLMLLATFSLLVPALARIWGILAGSGMPNAFGALILINFYIAALVIYDLKTRRALHAATIWGGGLLFASEPLRVWIGHSLPWRNFAAMLMG
jgi:uncharacterized membrane protein YozB (DUF420 family)